MNAPHANHPSPADLAAFAAGRLRDADARAVAAHLERCPDCRRAAASAPGDSFIARVQGARPSQPPGGTRVPGAGARSLAGPPPGLPSELVNHPRYRILRELGRGGMGVVYQARQTAMNRQVVIKVINQALLAHPDGVERFRREVHAAAQLAHPNIVTAHDAEQVGGLHMLVMEFVPGQSLAEVLHKKGPLPVREACHYARQVALGLQHAFEQGMVHRDIKPQNLMLTPKGQVKILDFGLAKVASEHGAGRGLTASGAYMGTPEYGAPEQATDARSADIRADLYSLGCTLYCLLAGHPPFQEDTAIKTILAHVEKAPPPLPELRPDVPAGLWAVVARLLAKDPARRYQQPAEVARALVPFIKPGPKVRAQPAPAPAPRTASTVQGNAVGGDTSRTPSAASGQRTRAPASRQSATAPQASPFAELGGAPARPEATKKVRPAAAAAWWKRWPVVAGAVGAVLVLLLGVVIRLKTRDGAGTLENVPADAGAPVPTAAPGKVRAYRHGDGRWRVEGDELIQEDANANIAILFFGDPTWADYDLTFEAQRIEGVHLCSAAFRVESLLDFWNFILFANARRISTRVDGTAKAVQDKGWTVDEAWHKLAVKVRGDRLQCFLDGELVFDLGDVRHPRGGVALNVAKTATRFRNLKVTDASGRVLVDGVRSLEWAPEQGDPAADDPARAGTVWRGKWRQTVDGKDIGDQDALLKIQKRDGAKFEGEYWALNETIGLKVEGTIDGLGNISWQATSILAGTVWAPNIRDVLFMGAIKGKQLRTYGYFWPRNQVAEVILRRDE
jgi:serine/threonine protein kinase